MSKTRYLDPSTKILMASGETNELKNIKIGDNVCGDDNTMRKVTNITSGDSTMYLVNQSKANAIDYIVNADHILVFRATGINPFISKAPRRDTMNLYYYIKCTKKTCNIESCSRKGFKPKTISCGSMKNAKKIKEKLENGELDENWVKDGDIFEMNINQFSNVCTKRIREGRLKSYKVPISNFGVKSKLPLDPYFLGLWLGDGTSKEPVITSPDIEIENYLNKFAKLYKNMTVTKTYVLSGIALSKGEESKTDCYAYRLVCDNQNPIRQILKSIDILDNKHIPEIYLNASDADRYKLLAGLIDSDGTLTYHKRSWHYRFSQAECNKPIYDGFNKIANSLGLNVRCYEDKCGSPTGKPFVADGKKFHKRHIIHLTGENILKIPCIIKRKNPQIMCKNARFLNNTASKIEIYAIDETEEHIHNKYIGITVDGNHRFLLADRTVT